MSGGPSRQRGQRESPRRSSDFPPDSIVVDDIAKGWPAILASLKSLLETGQALTIPFEAMNIEMPKE